MKERPILMSGAMVRATLRDVDPKTQTRRVFKQATGLSLSVNMDDDEPGVAELSWLSGNGAGHEVDETIQRVSCPYGKSGDRLYVRETWQALSRRHSFAVAPDYIPDADEAAFWEIVYAADDEFKDAGPDDLPFSWRPSIHMPRWACRLVLEIVDVRVERLQSITSDDCFAEGIDDHGEVYEEGDRFASAGSPVPPERYAFTTLWDSINAKRAPWASNPHVWVITFKRMP